jgi:transposase
MVENLFETALGIVAPWYIAGLDFDAKGHRLALQIDFKRGSRFSLPGVEGEHPVHDTVKKCYRHLNFFQYTCELEVRVPRVRLPEGGVRQVEPEWAGKLSGFTLLFEAFIVLMCRDMPFSKVAEKVKISTYHAMAICERYVDQAAAERDMSEVSRVAVDETSTQRGHDYVTLVADEEQRAVLFVTEGKDATTLERFVEDLKAHGGDPEEIESISMDMSAAFIKGATEQLPNAQITFDKFHIVAHASKALDETRRQEQKTDPLLKGLRWKLLRNPADLSPEEFAEIESLAQQAAGKRTLRAWQYREELRQILQRKQPNVVRRMLESWCTGVMNSKVEPMKKVAKMIRAHLDGIVSWTRTRQTNGFLEAINGLFQAAKRRARGFTRFRTIRMVIFLIAGKLDFSSINPAFKELSA